MMEILTIAADWNNDCANIELLTEIMCEKWLVCTLFPNVT